MSGDVRSGLTVLDEDECWRRLERAYTVWLAFAHRDELHVLPVNAAVTDGRIALRSGPGIKLAAARAGVRMAVSAGDVDETYHRGWSVTARGPSRLVEDDEQRAELDRLPLRPWARPAAEGEWIVIDVDTVTGRMIDPRARQRVVAREQ